MPVDCHRSFTLPQWRKRGEFVTIEAMNGQTETDILHSYSRGEIGWRRACHDLHLPDSDELDARCVVLGLPLPDGETDHIGQPARIRLRHLFKGVVNG